MQGVFALFLAGSFLLAFVEGQRDASVRSSSLQAQEQLRQTYREEAAQAFFGVDMTMEKIVEADPVFGERFTRMVDTYAVHDSQLKIMRLTLVASLASAEFEDVLAIRRLQLDWLRAIKPQTPRECIAVQQGHSGARIFEVAATSPENTLARSLLEKGVLGTIDVDQNLLPFPREARDFSVDGWIPDEAAAIAGLTSEEGRAAFSNPDDAHRCSFEAGLFELMLRKSDQMPADLLRQF